MLDLCVINVSQRLVITTDGRVLPITNMFDCQGEETDDADLAVSAVAGEEDCWFSFLLSNFVPTTIH